MNMGYIYEHAITQKKSSWFCLDMDFNKILLWLSKW